MVYIYRPPTHAKQHAPGGPNMRSLAIRGRQQPLGPDKEDSYKYGSDYYSTESVAKRKALKLRAEKLSEALSPRKAKKVCVRPPMQVRLPEPPEGGLRPAAADEMKAGELDLAEMPAPGPPTDCFTEPMERSDIYRSATATPQRGSSHAASRDTSPAKKPKDIKILNGLETVISKLQEQASELQCGTCNYYPIWRQICQSD